MRNKLSTARIACMVVGVVLAIAGTVAGLIAIYALHDLVVGGTASEATHDWIKLTSSLAVTIGGFAFALAAWRPYLRQVRLRQPR